MEHYIKHVERQIDQIERRVLKDKAGVPVELGVRVCVLEDQQ